MSSSLMSRANLRSPTARMQQPPGGSARVGNIPTVGRAGVPLGPSGGPIKYVEAIEGIVEVKTQPLWSTVEVAAAAVNFTVFFNFAVGANRYLTNMKQAGQLPGAVAYRLRRIGVGYAETITDADRLLAQEAGVAVINVAAKEVFEAPVKALPFGGGTVAVDTAAAAATNYANGLASYESMFKLAEAIVIKGGQDFNTTIYWGAGMTLGAATKVMVIFHGEMLIPVS